MNIVNRVLVSLISLIMIVVAGILLLVTLDALTPSQLAPRGWLRDRLIELTNVSGTDLAWAIGILAAVLVLGLLLFVAEFRSLSTSNSRMTVTESERGTVTIREESVRKIVDYEARNISGVIDSSTKVQERDHAVAIDCHATIEPGRNIPGLTQELQERIKAAVEHHLGRPVSAVDVETNVKTTNSRVR